MRFPRYHHYHHFLYHYHHHPHCQEIQYDQLLFWLKEFLFYNYVDDAVDRSVISQFLDEFVGQFLFEDRANPFGCHEFTVEEFEQRVGDKIGTAQNIVRLTADEVILSFIYFLAGNQLYEL